MSKKCKGCGVLLQQDDKNAIGYTPKITGDYCQRCFRITHYDDVVMSMQQGIDSDQILARIASMDALVLWVVDLFDFEANMIPGLNRHLLGKDIVMVAGKKDLLPLTYSNHKLADFLMMRLKEQGIFVKEVVISSHMTSQKHEEAKACVEDVLAAIETYRDGRDVVVMGMANAGKSTLLNGLCQNNVLTISRHPGTTLDFNQIDMGSYIMYDTPGLTRNDSLLTHVEDSLLKSVIPHKPLKPRVYQLYENQTLSLGGLVRIDFIGVEQISSVAYFAASLPLHRSKQEKADKLWNQHYNELLSPVLDEDMSQFKKHIFHLREDKCDIVIHGLGWFCISGKCEEIHVYCSNKVNVTKRKAMI